MQYLGFSLRNNLFVAPMAGLSDRPFRQLCRRMGAGLAFSEMVTSNSLLYGSAKTRRRAEHAGEEAPVCVQIAGSDPKLMADAARYNVENGAQIIDVNMGCPAKKVCKAMAGSALLKDEALVGKILESVVTAVPDTPVTLKTRTGWDTSSRNALNILKIAENSGVRALTLHGRTRACAYAGDAEYETIAAVKAEARIPVVANGDIASPEKAKYVLDFTQADAIMIGRAARGRPWLFREVGHYLDTGTHALPPKVEEIHAILVEHLESLYAFYGAETGVRVARKHIAWYTRGIAGSAAFRQRMNVLPDIASQLLAVNEFFFALSRRGDITDRADTNNRGDGRTQHD